MKTPLSHCSSKLLYSAGAAVLILLLWQAAAVHLNNDILLPSPLQVLSAMGDILAQPKNYASAAVTLFRVFRGLVISLAAVLVLLFLREWKPQLEGIMRPFVTIISTVPNISYMILAIIWLGSEGSVSAVTMMVLFPVLFSGLMSALMDEEKNLRDVQQLYGETLFWRIRLHLLPLLRFSVLRTLKTAMQLGFKVGVMAEIIGSVRMGVGRQMHFASLNLDTSAILAWTVLIILLSLAFTAVLDLMLKLSQRHEERSGIGC